MLVRSVLLLTLAFEIVTAHAVTIEITGRQSEPLSDVVVEIFAEKQQDVSQEIPKFTKQMTQRRQEFDPRVLVVGVGAQVLFPNEDKVMHHVYSFSKAKSFELELYKGTSHPPVRFDQPGVVRLGCNIHDSMRGYIYVSDANWYATSDGKGHVHFDLADGLYTAVLHHPRSTDAMEFQLEVTSDSEVFSYSMDLEARKRVVRGLSDWVKQ